MLLHGGAVNTDPSTIPPDKEAALKKGLAEALQAGWEILNRGGSALDAVEASVMSMEDNELFNAGRGGMFTLNGEVETEASIMDGSTLRGGAVRKVCLHFCGTSRARATGFFTSRRPLTAPPRSVEPSMMAPRCAAGP
jgi:isoaspartyl peptidase/L-asparaginase-like protein (Ntn-hydrolase superfamily)